MDVCGNTDETEQRKAQCKVAAGTTGSDLAV